MRSGTCGKCHQTVDQVHDGKEHPRDDDINSPWVFVDHVRDRFPDDPDLTGTEQCPGSGENQWTTDNSW